MEPREEIVNDLRLLAWEGAGPPMMLLHGLGDGADIWRPVVEEWPGGAPAALAVDLPGHGGSDHLPPGEYRVGEAARRLAEVIDRGAERPVLIGHSVGARIALALAADLRPAGVVLVDTADLGNPASDGLVRAHLERLAAGAPSREALAATILEALPLADPGMVGRAVRAMARPSPLGWQMPLDPAVAGYLIRDDDIAGGLAALDCPVAVVRGAFSAVCTAAVAARMAEAAGGCRVETVPRAGHAIPLQRPAALAAVLGEVVAGFA